MTRQLSRNTRAHQGEERKGLYTLSLIIEDFIKSDFKISKHGIYQNIKNKSHIFTFSTFQLQIKVQKLLKLHIENILQDYQHGDGAI